MLSEVDSTGLQATETYVSLTLNYVADRNLQLYSAGLLLRPNKTCHCPEERPTARTVFQRSNMTDYGSYEGCNFNSGNYLFTTYTK